MKARLTAQTEIDLLRGIDWFDRVSIGLGEKFEAEFYLALERIKKNPEMFAACVGSAGNGNRLAVSKTVWPTSCRGEIRNRSGRFFALDCSPKEKERRRHNG